MIAMLTDGVEYFEFKKMNKMTFRLENEKAQDDSFGEVGWSELTEDEIICYLRRLINMKKIAEGRL